MNPYESPESSSSLLQYVDAPDEHPRYNLIHKMVLWGEPKEAVMKRLAVNNVTGAEAELLYHHARKDRIATIRQEYRKKMKIGAFILAGTILYFVVSMVTMNTVVVPYALLAAVAIGMWQIVNGVSGFMMAESKQGSVADDID
ncbi:hypothetical protein N9F50_01630 [Akkermansiaceae bacterium]|nr:hypothetical protein [Akkermansiaceae bacterium]